MVAEAAAFFICILPPNRCRPDSAAHIAVETERPHDGDDQDEIQGAQRRAHREEAETGTAQEEITRHPPESKDEGPCNSGAFRIFRVRPMGQQLEARNSKPPTRRTRTRTA